MMFRIDLHYNAREVFEKMSDEKYDALKKIIIAMPDDRKESYWQMRDMVIDTDGLQALANEGIEVVLKKFKNTYTVPEMPEFAKQLSGPITHIHIPNIGLLSIKTITVHENACTDEIQNCLNKGWHILAICPPNAQRRPDYILGHNDEDAS